MTEKESIANDVIMKLSQILQTNVKVEIHFVDNIGDSWRQYATRDKVLQDYDNADFSLFHGLCLPFDGEKYHILIRDDYEEYLTTLVHEYTHAADYEEFRLKYHNSQIDIENNIYYPSLYVYSEFHARSNAHYVFLLAYDKNSRQDLYKIEIGAITDEINELKKNKYKMKRINFYYELTQLLGRIHSYLRLGFDVSMVIDENLQDLNNALSNLFDCWSVTNFERLKTLL